MKTATAGGLSVIPAAMEALDMIWDFPPAYDKAVSTVTLAIGVLGALGVTHKIAKYMAKREAK